MVVKTYQRYLIPHIHPPLRKKVLYFRARERKKLILCKIEMKILWKVKLLPTANGLAQDELIKKVAEQGIMDDDAIKGVCLLYHLLSGSDRNRISRKKLRASRKRFIIISAYLFRSKKKGFSTSLLQTKEENFTTNINTDNLK
jgi:hypothetical protein